MKLSSLTFVVPNKSVGTLISGLESIKVAEIVLIGSKFDILTISAMMALELIFLKNLLDFKKKCSQI